MTQERSERGKALEYEQNKRNVLTALAQQQQASAALAAAQAQSKVLRETALVTARAAVEAAQRKVDELSKDVAAMTVAAPFDGIVLWGDLSQGNWSNNGADALAAGAKVAPEQKLVTLIKPGETQVIAPIAEDRIARVAVGQPAVITPRALPELQLRGKVKSIAPAATLPGDPPKYEVVIETERPDARLLPGYRAAVEIDVDDATGVLLVPADAVSGGKVMLKAGEKTEPRDVVAARSDGEQVEIVRGLNEGDRVLARFKKD
jgi:multidrug efflux pump subunit AcrA (membrane-fusion protein)